MPTPVALRRWLRDAAAPCVIVLVLALAITGASVRDATAAQARPWTTLGGATLSLSSTIHSWQGSSGVTSAGVVWSVWEENGDIRSKSWNGTTWTDRGSVRGGAAAAGLGVEMTMVNDMPWVIYATTNGSIYQARIKRWNGSAWVAVGTTFNNYGVNAESLRIVTRDTTSVYIGFTELAFATVKQVTSAGVVTDLVGAASQDPFNECTANIIPRLDLAVVATKLWASVASDACSSPASGERVQVWEWVSGTTWTKRGPRVDPVAPDQNSRELRIASNGTAAGTYLVWRDYVGPDALEDYAVEVRQWVPGSSTWTDLDIATTTTTNDPLHVAVAPGGELWVTATDDTVSPHLFAFRWNGIAWRRYWTDTIDQFYNFSQEATISFDASSRPILTGRESTAGYNQMFVRRLDTSNAMPGDIAGLQAEVLSPTSASLAWTIPASSNINSVNIYRSTVAGTRGTLVQSVVAPTATWTNTGLAAATTYYYTVVSVNAAGDERGTSFETSQAVQPAGTGASVSTDGTVAWWLGFGATRSSTYTPATDTIATNGALATARARAGSAWSADIGRVVLLGGTRAGVVTSAITEFDPVAGTESGVVASLPAARGYAAVARSERTGLIYLFGGEDASETIAYTDIYEYDPVARVARDTGMDLPVAASRSTALYWPLDGCFYHLGGRPTDAAPGGANQNLRLSSVVRFCPAIAARPATVATVGTLATGVAEFGAYATDNDFVVVGGDNGVTSITQVSTWSPRTGEARVASFALRSARVGASPSRALGDEDRGLFSGVYPYSDPLGRRIIQVNSAPMVSMKPTNNAPATPTITNLVDAEVVGPNPTFTSSAFSDPDGGSSHRVSQWQVFTMSGCSSTMLEDTGPSSASKTSYRYDQAVHATGFRSVRVRYADEGMRWSAWSPCVWYQLDATKPFTIAYAPNPLTYTTLQPTMNTNYAESGGAPTGTVEYEVCTDAACTAVAQSGSVPGVVPNANAAWTPPTPLTSGTTYWWRARGVDSVGNVGNWTSSRQFYPITVTVAASTRGSGNAAPAGVQNLTVDVTGTNFVAGATLAFSGADITLDSGFRLNATTMRAVIDIAPGATLGGRDVTVTNPGGTTATGSGVFHIRAPVITVGMTSRSHDNTTQTGTSTTLGFGSMAPGSTREIGTGSGGPSGAAVSLGVSSEVGYRVDSSFSAFTGPAPLAIDSLDLRSRVGPGPWIDADTSVVELVAPRAAEAPATTNFGYDLRLATPAAQTPGLYSTTWTLVAVPTV